MKVAIFHKGHRDTNESVHVANIKAEDEWTFEDMLEYAWRWTNNVAGSWSRGPYFEDGVTANGDFNPNTEVLVPLPVYSGKTYGHRSSMVGDIFVIRTDDDKDISKFEVDFIGFKNITNA